MSKINKKVIDKLFNDLKISLYISEVLEANNIIPFYFYEYLRNNEVANKEFERIEKFNNTFKEAQIERKAYNSTIFKNPILMEMIKAKDKKKYNTKIEIENTTNITELDDEELSNKIKALQDKLNK